MIHRLLAVYGGSPWNKRQWCLLWSSRRYFQQQQNTLLLQAQMHQFFGMTTGTFFFIAFIHAFYTNAPCFVCRAASSCLCFFSLSMRTSTSLQAISFLSLSMRTSTSLQVFSFLFCSWNASASLSCFLGVSDILVFNQLLESPHQPLSGRVASMTGFCAPGGEPSTDEKDPSTDALYENHQCWVLLPSVLRSSIRVQGNLYLFMVQPNFHEWLQHCSLNLSTEGNVHKHVQYLLTFSVGTVYNWSAAGSRHKGHGTYIIPTCWAVMECNPHAMV